MSSRPTDPAARLPWTQRHRLLARALVSLSVLVVTGLIAEVVLRFTTTYNPGYYVVLRDLVPNTETEYPWGLQKINSEGCSDDEFDLSRDVRIGYVGDSVMAGVGCGYGYRLSELLEESYPDYLHANISLAAYGVESYQHIDEMLALVERFRLTTLVLGFNLNDILPDAYSEPDAKQPLLRRGKLFVAEWLDWLRGRSYLYSHVRRTIKNYFLRRNIEFHGYPAAELFPLQHEQSIVDTARRVNVLNERARALGCELIVLLLPYEMQISEEAAETYARHGIQWSPEFLAGRTQEMFASHVDQDITCIDLLPAFVDPAAPERSRAENAVGEYFVYNKGDKLDWNHPNRAGHRRMAEYLIGLDIFGHLGEHARPLDVGRD